MKVDKLIEELRELQDMGYGDYEAIVTVDCVTQDPETKLIDLVKKTVTIE